MGKRLRVNMDVIPGIYAIVNIVNGNRYVGSSKDIYGRWVQHQNELNKNKHHNSHLQRAWNLYTKEVFEFRILEQTDDNIQILFEREQFWYDYYRDKNIILYNVSPIAATSSGPITIDDLKNGKRKTSYEQFLKICELLRDTELPFYQIAEMTATYTNQVYMIYSKIYFSDLTSGMTFKIRSNKGENSVNAKLTEKAVKCIIQQMLDGEYSSDLARQYGVSQSTIDDIRHHRIWNHLTQNIVFPYPKAFGRNGKTVLQYDIEGNFIAEYKNAREAERMTGIGFKMISRVCNGKRPHTHGFIFKFKTIQND